MKLLLSTLFSNTVSLQSFLNVKNPSFTPIQKKNQGKLESVDFNLYDGDSEFNGNAFLVYLNFTSYSRNLLTAFTRNILIILEQNNVTAVCTKCIY
jgi:hypothetical protein